MMKSMWKTNFDFEKKTNTVKRLQTIMMKSRWNTSLDCERIGLNTLDTRD